MTPRSFVATFTVAAGLVVCVALTPANYPSSRIDDTAAVVTAPAAPDYRLLPIEDVAYAINTPCPTEDSPDCYWDADVMGNGAGRSFVNVHGNLFPLPGKLTAGDSQ